jgi:hypothetical protein
MWQRLFTSEQTESSKKGSQLPPATPNLPKFPEPPKIASPSSQHMSFWGVGELRDFISKPYPSTALFPGYNECFTEDKKYTACSCGLPKVIMLK